MGPFIYQSRKNGSVIYSFLGKRGLIVYLAALKKGAIIFGPHIRTMSYIGSYPPHPDIFHSLSASKIIYVYKISKGKL